MDQVGIEGGLMREKGLGWLVFFFILTVGLLLVPEGALGWEIEIVDPEASETIGGIYRISGEVHEDYLNDTGDVHQVNVSIDDGSEMVADADGPAFSTWHFDWETYIVENGEHTITAHLYLRRETGEGGEGNQSEYEYWEETNQTITIYVNNTPPVAVIDTPSAEVNITFGDRVGFSGHGEPGPGRSIVEYYWRSTLDTRISTNASFNTSSLSPGEHSIVFKVRDDQGQWSDPVSVVVRVSLPEPTEWPFLQGDLMRTGAVPDGPVRANVMWNFTSGAEGRTFGSPVVYDGRVYAAENVDDGRSRYGVLHAFDAEGTHNGIQGTPLGHADLLWNVTLVRPISAVPACRDGRVFVGTQWAPDAATIHCFDAAAGVELWNATLSGTVYSSPVVTEDMVIVISGDMRVRALDPATGEEIWREYLGTDVFTSPLLVGGQLYILAGDGALYRLDLRTGETTLVELGGSHTVSPIFGDGRLFMVARASVGDNDRLVARNRFDLTDGAAGAWTTVPGGRIYTMPVLANDEIFIVTQAGVVYAYDLSGNPTWSLDLTDTVTSTPAVGGDLLYVPSASGVLYAVNITAHETAWSAVFGQPLTSPAIAGDRLYIGCGEELLALWEVMLPSAEIVGISPATIPDLPVNDTWYQHGIPQDPVTVSENISLDMIGAAEDPTGLNITAWHWTSSIDGALGNTTNITVTLSAGNHTIRFRAMNEEGTWSPWAIVRIVVFSNERPVVRLSIERPYAGEFTSFDLSASNDTDGSVHLFVIDFGDGSDPVPWKDPSKPVTHRYEEVGNYAVKIVAYDDHGLASSPGYQDILTITKRTVTTGDGDGGDEDGALLGDLGDVTLLAGVAALVILLVFVALITLGHQRKRPKAKKARMVEFEEDALAEKPKKEVDVDEKERALAEIQRRIERERVLERKRAAIRRRQAAPGRPASPPSAGKKVKARRSAPPGEEPAGEAPEKGAARPARAPPAGEAVPPKPQAPEEGVEAEGSPSAEGNIEAPPEEKVASGPETLAEKKSSLEDLLKELEAMKKRK